MKPIAKSLLILFFIQLNIFNYINAQTFVKVLLAEANQSKPATWVFKSVNNFRVIIPKKDMHLESQNMPCANLLVKKSFEYLKIDILNNKIYVNGKHYKLKQIKLIADQSPISINDNLYDGNFIIYQDKNNNVFLINQVQIEDYICSVLKTESWPGWPKEVNKVFAIASRSYVLAQVLIARRSKLPYHIKNTNHHQTYSGIHNEQTIKMAVLETTGIILGHNNEPILAMFDSCCGGIIPAHIDGFDFQRYPYLARHEQCKHCKLVKMYSWRTSFSSQDFKKIIQAKMPKLNHITKITTKTDKAGTVKNITVHSQKDNYSIDARTMYSLFKDIKSFCYSFCHESNRITVSGVGVGHHLGLCQWGAREMVRKGYSYDDILKFYYPGAKFMRIKHLEKNINA